MRARRSESADGLIAVARCGRTFRPLVAVRLIHEISPLVRRSAGSVRCFAHGDAVLARRRWAPTWPISVAFIATPDARPSDEYKQAIVASTRPTRYSDLFLAFMELFAGVDRCGGSRSRKPAGRVRRR